MSVRSRGLMRIVAQAVLGYHVFLQHSRYHLLSQSRGTHPFNECDDCEEIRRSTVAIRVLNLPELLLALRTTPQKLGYKH